MDLVCTCGMRHFFGETINCVKCRCGETVYGDCNTKVDAQSKIDQEANRWVRLIRLLRKPEDKGVGDTVARIAARFGGERFKEWSKRIGIPCGCTERQIAWNERWPY